MPLFDQRLDAEGGIKGPLPLRYQVISIQHGPASSYFMGVGVQSARSNIELSRDLIMSFLGHHIPLYNVGVNYRAFRKLIKKKC